MEISREDALKIWLPIIRMGVENMPECKESLDMAIASLKTDEAYQLMHEGGEVFTKADMVAMLTEIQMEIEELDFFEGEEPINITQELIDEVKSWEYGVKDCKKLIQEKINKLKGEEDGKID